MAGEHAAWAQAREEFLALVGELRPELHRYCARLAGSVIQGEDIVQDALAKAFYAITLQPEPPPLRPWLFRIAHEAAVDHLRRHGQKYTAARADMDDLSGFDDEPDPEIVRAAPSRFLVLTIAERSAVILKDVLGHSLQEAAATMDTTLDAVKAALVRGRAKLRDADERVAALDDSARAILDAYAARFNARDWDGVRALVAEDCGLDLVSKSRRRGTVAGMYVSHDENANVRLEVVQLESRLALAAFVEGAPAPAYFILLEHAEGRVCSIRDYRYVPYIAREAEFH